MSEYVDGDSGSSQATRDMTCHVETRSKVTKKLNAVTYFKTEAGAKAWMRVQRESAPEYSYKMTTGQSHWYTR